MQYEQSNNDVVKQSRQPSTQPEVKKTVRGKYKLVSQDIKLQALDRIRQGASIRVVAEEMDIPMKNLHRWMKYGANRKKGGGRKKYNDQIEVQLFQWCMDQGLAQGRPVSRIQIKEKALEMSNCEKFVASKGWIDKFVRKFQARKLMVKTLRVMGVNKYNKI